MSDSVDETVRALLEQAQNPCIWWSGGKESQLLLHYARRYRPEVAVVWFRGVTGRRQMEWINGQILEQNLSVFAVSPNRRYLLDDGQETWVMVDEAIINGAFFPVVRDIATGDRCYFELPTERSGQIEYPFDVTLTGWRNEDAHPLFQGPIPYPADATVIGGSRFYAPLRELNERRVWELIDTFGVAVDRQRYADDVSSDPDTVQVCTQCLRASAGEQVWCPKSKGNIPAVEWNREATREWFRSLITG